MENTEEGNHLLLTRDFLDVGGINALATSSTCGAISLFVGTTRDNFEGKRVLSLEYEAYEPMALKEMQAICFELRRRWPDIAKIVMHHRIGLVPVGQASVVIAISTPHRVSALEAVSLAIEELKKRVPIWKKEKYEGEESAWKENKECDFDEKCCSVQDNNLAELPSQFIQISATEMEIHRRIKCFVEKKREEIDINNIIDYARPPTDANFANANACESKNSNTNSEDVETCARTNSTIIKQESSKGHLKVSHTQNYIGPQIRHCFVNNINNTSSIGDVKPIKISQGNESKGTTMASQPVLDRIENIEEYLNMRNGTKQDVHSRLKALEQRLLYLESLSPEYRHFLFDKSQNLGKSYPSVNLSDTADNKSNIQYLACNNTKVYNISDINSLIDEMS